MNTACGKYSVLLGGAAAVSECFCLAWINARCPPMLLCHSPSSTGQGRWNMKGSRVETRTGRDHSPVTVTGKTD